MQRGIHRGMWMHDDGFAVGKFGDKAWAEWIMSHVRPGTTMGCLGGYPLHSATAMQYLTNQDVGEDADAWLAWWKKNKSKSQVEWIADGFAEAGFAIDVPPTPDQTDTILTLLGDPEADESDSIPERLKYNAFRCLRDSGFDPVQFALSNRAISPDVERGLLDYSRRHRRLPEAMGLGVLPFADQDDAWEGYSLPPLLQPAVQVTAYALIVAPAAFGAVLILWSFRRRNRRAVDGNMPETMARQ